MLAVGAGSSRTVGCLMPRDFAQLKVSMLNDPGFRDLGFRAQHLYLMILGHSTLSYVGVADWRPNRLMPLARDWTPHDFYSGAVELADKAWLVIDSDSEEALVRSFLRHDPVLHQPRLAVSMVKAYDKVASATLRAAVVHELRRLHFDQPRLKAWEDERVLNILDHPAVDGKDIAPGFDVPLGVGLGGGLGQTLLSVSGSPTTSTSTSTATSNLQPDSDESEGVDKSSRWTA